MQIEKYFLIFIFLFCFIKFVILIVLYAVWMILLFNVKHSELPLGMKCATQINPPWLNTIVWTGDEVGLLLEWLNSNYQV